MSRSARLLILLIALVVLGPTPVAADVPTLSDQAVAIFGYDVGTVSACGYDDRPEHLEKSLCPVAFRPTAITESWRADASASFQQKFTGKERDAETGLDYFGARYFSGAMGRFTSSDPLLASAVAEIPQSWNRYTYGLNNPLRYIDPTGMAWVQNDGSTWEWVSSCGGVAPDVNCRSAVAVQTEQGVTVYGSTDANDIRRYTANDAGVVDVSAVAQHHDSNFLIGPQRVAENYLNPQTAAALFNVASDYGAAIGHARDGKLVFTGGSASTGGPGGDPVTGQPLHQSHQGGENIDMRYMGANGQSLVGISAAATGDINRNRAIMNLFHNAGANLGATLTGDPQRYGLAPISPGLQRIHRNHMHFQRRYPAVR